MTSPTAYAYIGRTRCCGNVVLVEVDAPEDAKDIARVLGRAIRDGLVIERATVEDVRGLTYGCRCHAEAVPQ